MTTGSTHDAPTPTSMPLKTKSAARYCIVFATYFIVCNQLAASDHADPIDPFNKERLEGGITDLFVFPVNKNDEVAFPFNRQDGISLQEPNVNQRPALKPEDKAQIDALIVILCVRRQLTQTGSLRLEPYTYRIHMDLFSTVSFEDSQEDQQRAGSEQEGGAGYQEPRGQETVDRPTGQEGRARYGGLVQRPQDISPTVTIELRLKNDPSQLNGEPLYSGLKNTKEIKLWTGVRDDPFIFPAFFRTNVVAMVLRIPVSCFPAEREDFIVWGTSHKGSRQIDHVGRSLRTQNPRFELLNTLPPSQHAAAIMEEHDHPGLLRDIFLRLNFQQTFAYRKWDFVPDVLLYTTRYEVGFPNGRLLTDDVAALLAQHGDTLLLELSHHGGGWPRRTTNDMPFDSKFPFLAAPWPDQEPPDPPSLSRASKVKLFAIALLLLLLFVLENWLVAHLYCRKKLRKRYL